MSHHNNDPILNEIIELTNQDPSICYQCGKCSAGCPLREFEDTPVNKVIRYVQLGFYDKALESPAIWMCAGCLTCSARCPKNFEPAKLMDALRIIAIRKGIAPSDKKAYKFHKSFINQIKAHGRSYELGFVLDYKLSSGALMQDVDVAPSMYLKGKINLLPHNLKNKEAMKDIFRKVEEEEK